MRTLLVAFLCCTSVPFARAQSPGLRGAAQEPPLVTRLAPPDTTAAERVITIEGIAQVRVVPTSLRVVFALSAAAPPAAAASAAARELVAATSERLTAGAGAGAIDVDFIAVVPVYAWIVEDQAGQTVLAEKRTGSRVQYNLHVAVADEAAARTAIEAATAADGVELLAVDYWSDALEQQQGVARERALAAAQQKAALLLSVFEPRPRPINVHEHTVVLFPQQLYRNLARAEESAAAWYGRDNVPRVPAARPLQVYYRGLFADVDAGEKAMPGRRDLEIVATVRLYYLAPERPPLAK
jgi:uncharacterized protein YggE